MAGNLIDEIRINGLSPSWYRLRGSQTKFPYYPGSQSFTLVDGNLYQASLTCIMGELFIHALTEVEALPEVIFHTTFGRIIGSTEEDTRSVIRSGVGIVISLDALSNTVIAGQYGQLYQGSISWINEYRPDVLTRNSSITPDLGALLPAGSLAWMVEGRLWIVPRRLDYCIHMLSSRGNIIEAHVSRPDREPLVRRVADDTEMWRLCKYKGSLYKFGYYPSGPCSNPFKEDFEIEYVSC